MSDFPILVIDYFWRKNYQSKLNEQGVPVTEVETVQELKQFVRDNMLLRSQKPIALADLGKFKQDYLSNVLKFIEESKSPLILISSRDNIPQVLLSRIKRLIKSPHMIPIGKTHPKTFLANIIEEGKLKDTYNGSMDCIKHYPVAYKIFSQLKTARVASKEKIIEVLLT